MPRSTGVLGSSRPYWDYVGSSYRGTQDETLQNPYCRISGKTPVMKRVSLQCFLGSCCFILVTKCCSHIILFSWTQPRRRISPKEKDKEVTTEKITPEREQTAGQVWLAECDFDIIGCIFRENESRAGIRRICRVVTGCWYRREGLGRLLVQSLEQRERETGAHRVYAHVPFPSKVGEVFFRKLGYQLLGEGTNNEDDEERNLEAPERGFLGYPLTKVFYKDLWWRDDGLFFFFKKKVSQPVWRQRRLWISAEGDYVIAANVWRIVSVNNLLNICLIYTSIYLRHVFLFV